MAFLKAKQRFGEIDARHSWEGRAEEECCLLANGVIETLFRIGTGLTGY